MDGKPVGSKYAVFDRSRLVIKPLAERVHDLQLDRWMALDASAPPYSHPQLEVVAARLIEA